MGQIPALYHGGDNCQVNLHVSDWPSAKLKFVQAEPHRSDGGQTLQITFHWLLSNAIS